MKYSPRPAFGFDHLSSTCGRLFEIEFSESNTVHVFIKRFIEDDRDKGTLV